MRKGFVILLCALLALASVSCAAADETAYRVVMDDAAGLMDSAEEAQVQAEMEAVAQYCNVGCYTAGSGSADVLDKAEAWGRREFGDTEFTVFIIDMATRRIGIFSSRGIVRVVTKAKANVITDNVYKLASAGKYGECAAEAFRQEAQVLGGYKIASPMRTATNALVAVAAAILLAYLLIYSQMEKETKVSVPGIITVMAAGAGTAVLAKKLTRTVRHESSSGHGGSFGGGGGGGFSGGGGGGGGSHGF